jgi:hypothetical protein
MDPILTWMEGTWINTLAVSYQWSWPILETLHFVGLCLLMGPIIIIDLRLIGYARLLPAVSVHSLVPVAIAGFSINLITGIIFCFGDPYRYAVNIAFQTKMVLVVLAGLNALAFKYMVSPAIDAPNADVTGTPPIAKLVGFVSLVIWIGVLSLGRLIPYLGTG